MKLKEKNNSYVVVWSRTKEPDLTWRKVKDWCKAELEKIDSSKEAKEIEAIRTTIEILKHKVKLFEEKRKRYEGMYYSISLSDPDIDKPFGTKEGDAE